MDEKAFLFENRPRWVAGSVSGVTWHGPVNMTVYPDPYVHRPCDLFGPVLGYGGGFGLGRGLGWLVRRKLDLLGGDFEK